MATKYDLEKWMLSRIASYSGILTHGPLNQIADQLFAKHVLNLSQQSTLFAENDLTKKYHLLISYLSGKDISAFRHLADTLEKQDVLPDLVCDLRRESVDTQKEGEQQSRTATDPVIKEAASSSSAGNARPSVDGSKSVPQPSPAPDPVIDKKGAPSSSAGDARPSVNGSESWTIGGANYELLEKWMLNRIASYSGSLTHGVLNQISMQLFGKHILNLIQLNNLTAENDSTKKMNLLISSLSGKDISVFRALADTLEKERVLPDLVRDLRRESVDIQEEAPEATAAATGSFPPSKRLCQRQEASAKERSHSSASAHHMRTKESGETGGQWTPKQANDDDVPTMPTEFCGRSDIIESILKKVRDESSDRVVSLAGPPGFGKTSIALAVRKCLKEQGNTHVIFVSLRGVHDSKNLVAKVSNAISPPSDDSNKKSTLFDLLKQISEHCLIILDNAEDFLDAPTDKGESGPAAFASEVKKIIACNNKVKLLITSRTEFQTIEFNVSQVRVKGLTEEAAVELLEQLSANISREDATEIVRCCGLVPLAVRIAAGIMRYDHLSATEFIDHFDQVGTAAIDSEGTWLKPEQRLPVIVEAAVKRMTVELQQAFHALSLFPASFSADAAAAVLDVTDTVQLKKVFCSELQRRCLLDYDTASERYSMQPFLSQFGKEKCPSEEATVFRRKFSFYFLQGLLDMTIQCQFEGQLLQLVVLIITEMTTFESALDFADVLDQDDLRALSPLAETISLYLPCQEALTFLQHCLEVVQDVKCQNNILTAQLHILLQLNDWQSVDRVVESILQNKDKMDMSKVENLHTLLFAAIAQHAYQLASTFWNPPDSPCSCSLHKLIDHISTHVNPTEGIAETTLCFLASITARHSCQQANLSPEGLLLEILQEMKNLDQSTSWSSTSHSSSPSQGSSLSSSASEDWSQDTYEDSIDFYLCLLAEVWFTSVLSIPFSSSTTENPETSSLLEVTCCIEEQLPAKLFNANGFSVVQLFSQQVFRSAFSEVVSARIVQAHRSLTVDSMLFQNIRLTRLAAIVSMVNPAFRLLHLAEDAEINDYVPAIQQELSEAIRCLPKREIQYSTMLIQQLQAPGGHCTLLENVIEEQHPSVLQSGSDDSNVIPHLQIIPICSVPFFAEDALQFAIMQRIVINTARSGINPNDIRKTFELYHYARVPRCAHCLAEVGLDARDVINCQRCHVVEYCSQLCQQWHKKEHKKSCDDLEVLCKDGQISSAPEFRQQLLSRLGGRCGTLTATSKG